MHGICVTPGISVNFLSYPFPTLASDRDFDTGNKKGKRWSGQSPLELKDIDIDKISGSSINFL